MLLLQVQMLLAAVSALLPFVPAPARARIGEILDIASAALSAGADLEELVQKLAAVRAETEAMAVAGRPLSAEEFGAALLRVRAAAARFRAALKTAEERG